MKQGAQGARSPRRSLRELLATEGVTLRKFALAFPEATEEMPWGHHAIKVKGKSFVFLAADAKEFSMSAKLPSSAGVALKLPYASPTEYGLGKSGWVTARFPRGKKVPVEILKMWIDESYRAIAPKRLVAQIEGAEVARSQRRALSRAPRDRRASRDRRRDK